MSNEVSGRLVEERMRLAMGVLGLHRELLQSLGMRYELALEGPPTDSEIAVYFYRRGDIVDVLEFSATRDGAPVGTKSEVERWLSDSVQDVVRRATATAEGGTTTS